MTPSTPFISRVFCRTALALGAALLVAACGGGGGTMSPSGGGGGGGGGIQPGVWGPVTVPVDSGAAAAKPELIGMDANGNAVAVWTEPNGRMMASAYVAGGGWGADTQVDGNTGNQANPQLSVSGNGTAMLVWLEGATFKTVSVHRFVPGTGWENLVKPLNAPGTAIASATSLSVAMDAAGNAWSVWSEDTAVKARYYNAASGSWGAENHIATGLRPSLAMNASGEAIVMFEFGAPSRVFGIRSTAGGAWSAPEAADDGASNADRVTVALDGDGTAMALWIQNAKLTGNVQPAGMAWNAMPETLFNDVPGRYVAAASSATGTMGAWTMETGSSSPPVQVNTATFADVSGWSTDTADTAASFVTRFDIGLDVGGNAIAVWLNQQGIFANRHTPTGGWGTPEPVYDGLDTIASSRLGVSGNGTAMAIWKHGFGKNDVAWSRYAP